MIQSDRTSIRLLYPVLIWLSGMLAASSMEVQQKEDSTNCERIMLALQKLAQARQNTLQVLKDKLAAHKEGVRIEATLEDAVLQIPMLMELHVMDGRLIDGNVRVPGYHKSVNPVLSKQFAITEQSIKGTVEVRLISDGWNPPPGSEYKLEFDLDLQINASKVTGSFKALANPEFSVERAMVQGETERLGKQVSTRGRTWTKRISQEALTGPVQGAATVFKLFPPQLNEAVKVAAPEQPADYSIWAQECERLAENYYQDIRVAKYAMHFQREWDDLKKLLPFIAAVRRSGAEVSSAGLVQIADRIERMALSTQRMDQNQDHDKVLTGTITSHDPEFIGIFCDENLPGDPMHPNHLSTVESAAAFDEWRYLTHWRTYGPFYFDGAPTHATEHPEFIEAIGAVYKAGERFIESLTGRRGLHKHTLLTTDISKGEAFSGLEGPKVIGPWPWSLKDPIAATIMYGCTELYSKVEQKVWVAIECNDYGALWVNDRLIWNGGNQWRGVCVFQISLQAGSNRLLVRCQNDKGGTYYWMKACIKGSPRSEDSIKNRNTSMFTMKPPEPRTMGWRGDGTGVFASQEPPLAWDIEKGINVRWRVPLKQKSNATPLVVKDKVFVNAEPHTLICLHKDTGEILWQKDANILEFIADEKERAQALNDYERELNALEKPESTEKTAIKAQLGELNDRLDADRNNKDLKQEIEKLNEQLAKVEEDEGRGFNYWGLKLGVRHLNHRGGGLWGDVTGFTMGTPVTDGIHIWVKYGTGVAACFDLDGNRRWMVRTYFDNAAVTNVPSPILVDDTLVLIGGKSKYWETNGPAKEKDGRHTCWIIGLDANTGAIRWNYGPIPNGGYGGPVTPVAFRLVDELGKEHAYVATGEGLLFRVADGVLALRNIGGRSGFASPFLLNNTLHYHNWGMTGVQLAVRSTGQLGTRQLFSGGGIQGSGGHVYNNGHLFVCQSADGHKPMPPSLGVYNAENGKLVRYLKEFTPRLGGLQYANPAASGKYIYMWCEKWAFIFEAGPNPQLLAENRVEPMFSGPFIQDNRIYLRTHHSAICLERTGGEGMLFESQSIAQFLMEPYLGTYNKLKLMGNHSEVAAKKIKPQSPERLAHLPEMRLVNDRAMRDWLVLGPFSGRETPLKAHGGIENFCPPDSLKLDYDSKMISFAPISQEHVTDAGLNLDLLTGITRGNQTFLFSKLHVPGSSFIKTALATKGIRCYLEGEELIPGKTYALERGKYLLSVQIMLGLHHPGNQRMIADIKFNEVPDPNEEFTRYDDRIRANAGVFDRVIRIAPGSSYAKTAKDLKARIEASQP